jgi:hypothetical protein
MNPSGLMADSLFGVNGDNRAWAEANDECRPRHGLLNLTVFGVQFHSQDNFALEVDPSFVRLEHPFTIFLGITMPAGSQYHFTRFALRGQTANRRVVALNGRFETGSFYSGHRDQTVLGLTVRARPGYIFSLNGDSWK